MALQLHRVVQHAADLHDWAVGDPVQNQMSGSDNAGLLPAVAQMIGSYLDPEL